MEFYYSSDRNVQMIISVLKANDIKKIVVSPGSTHIPFVASVQQDSYFELYSAVDERGAAYFACGLAMESNQPVVITCTGATASRNYLPGLSEAFYRKLPIIAITGSQNVANAGHLSPQFIDRSQCPKDVVKISVDLQLIDTEEDEWDCNVKINKAILECKRHGGGPVHINLPDCQGEGLIVKELPYTRVIRRYMYDDKLPSLDSYKKIAISIGAHKLWSDEETKVLEEFCEEYNAVVFADHSSSYHGKYKVLPTIVASQGRKTDIFDIDLLLHIGETSGDYYTYWRLMRAKEVWRISDDGEIRDTFKKLTNVFEMSEKSFFAGYVTGRKSSDCSYYKECIQELRNVYNLIPELPFSNIYVAQRIAPNLPDNSVIQLGVSNTMRSWTFFEIPDSVMAIANVGCRGIDGTLSSVIGMSQVDKNRIHFCALGDLTFFYNMNALAEKTLNCNIRILLVNNEGGAEFNMYSHRGKQQLGDAVNEYVAASGHYGKKSKDLVRHYAQDLGFEYYSASDKNELEEALVNFLKPEITEKPILLEVFTDHKNESEALNIINNLIPDNSKSLRKTVKNILGEKGTEMVRNILK